MALTAIFMVGFIVIAAVLALVVTILTTKKGDS
jgi:hypothetical protein